MEVPIKSRPNSILLEGFQPEKEPLKFDIELEGAPPEVEQLVIDIKRIAEDFLYHWKTFPIVLPQSQFTKRGYRLSDLIIPPTCDELDAAALDAGVDPHPLSAKQLYSIREHGEFEVPSRNFPGQTHRWQVASWLQKGRNRLREDFFDSIAYATVLIVIMARDRLVKDKTFSVVSGFKSLMIGLRRLLDLLIGMPYLEARELDKKIRDERSRYLVAELICKPDKEEEMNTLASWFNRTTRRLENEKLDVREVARNCPNVPVEYGTPSGVEIDLRLYRRDALRPVVQTLSSILESESMGWFLRFRENMINQLRDKKVPEHDYDEEIRVASMREYVRRVSAALESNELLQKSQLTKLLIDQLHTTAILERHEESERQKVKARLMQAEAKIRNAHPLLSRCSRWMRERMQREEISSPVAPPADTLNNSGLIQQRYFLMRDYAFTTEREALLLKELSSAKSPSAVFSFATRIWLRTNWRKSLSPPSPNQRLLLAKHSYAYSNTSNLMWRVVNAALRIWSYTWNALFLFGVLVPWFSPVSIRTLTCIRPFVTEYIVSQNNGAIVPKRGGETHTMWSRLLIIWRHVSKERTKFETKPDQGLLGKGLARLGNRLWNYLIVGSIGSIFLLLLWPPLVLVINVLSFIAAILSLVVVPVLVVSCHFLSALLWEVDCVVASERLFPLPRVLIWRIAILGIIQPLAAIFVACVVCPLCSLLVIIAASITLGVRLVWERCWFVFVIRSHARTPTKETSYCKRIHGPGITSSTYITITWSQALASVCSWMELSALSVWYQKVESAIQRPLRDYNHFVQACFGPFSVQIANTGAYKQLQKECADLVASLRESVSKRQAELKLPLSDELKTRVRMSASDLKDLFSESHSMSGWHLEQLSEEWWSSKGLQPMDWTGLMANIMLEMFGSEVLTPLSESACESKCGGVVTADMWIQTNNSRTRPDLIGDTHAYTQQSWYSGVSVRGVCPRLSVRAFSVKGGSLPQLPTLHHIALLLYNRDAENPLPLDSDVSVELLNCLEEMPDSEEKKGIRYRTVDSDATSLFSSDNSYESDDNGNDERDVDSTCKLSVRGATSSCRWSLRGRVVRIKADLASPEDSTLEIERQGTSV